MRLSKYTIFYDDYPAKDECLALNTRTQAVVVVGRELKEIMERLPKNGQPAGSPALMQDNLTPETYQLLNQLEDSGILVQDNVDEEKLMRNWFNRIKYQSGTLTSMILTTYNCNFACEYCFEEAVKRHLSMSDETTFRTIQWLKDEVNKRHPSALRLIFYGGEPFLNPVPIMAIGEAMNRFARDKGIKFSFSAITNGSLINMALIGELRRVGLNSLRVTLDGTPEVHNKRRPFLSGHGTFDTIMENIRDVAGIVRVDIAGNFDKENMSSLIGMLDLLKARGLDKKIGTVMFAPVMARMGTENGTIEQTGCSCLSNEMMDDALVLRRETIKRGFRVDPAVAVSACPMTRDGSMAVIDPKGDIYKCAGFVGRDEFCVGNIWDDKLNQRNIDFISLPSPLDEVKCRDCKFLPMCGGGCHFSAQLRHGDYTQMSCEKEYYERAFPEILKMEYARGALAG
jgi:uncharacterized protein